MPVYFNYFKETTDGCVSRRKIHCTSRKIIPTPRGHPFRYCLVMKIYFQITVEILIILIFCFGHLIILISGMQVIHSIHFILVWSKPNHTKCKYHVSYFWLQIINLFHCE